MTDSLFRVDTEYLGIEEVAAENFRETPETGVFFSNMIGSGSHAYFKTWREAMAAADSVADDKIARLQGIKECIRKELEK